MQEQIAQKFPLVASSVDPKKISLSIKGILIAWIPVITLLSGLAGLDLEESVINNLIESIVQITFAGSTALAAILTAYGVARKVVKKVQAILNKNKQNDE
jgi:hypothetical protein